jgi:hypothetical protein
LADEYCACDFAIDLPIESKAAIREGERRRIALDDEILDCDNFAAWKQVPQLLVDGVGVGNALRRQGRKASRCEKQNG